MKVIISLSLLLILALVSVSAQSSGCGKPNGINTGTLVTRNIQISNPGLGSTSRSYVIYIPRSYNINTATPLMIYYHGQYGTGGGDARNSKYTAVADTNGYIAVFPNGMGDGNCGTGWNVGNNEGTCTNQAWSCCYTSCRTLGDCTNNNHRCKWSTCYDDVLFTEEILTSLGDLLCIDEKAEFITGGSNGGMMTHYIYGEVQNLDGFVPVFGLPLRDRTNVPSARAQSSIMSLHPRSDRVIPPNGGLADGWYYETADNVFGRWASVKNCNNNPSTITVPFPSRSNRNLECQEYLNCNQGRVIRCLYDGGHGAYYNDLEAMTWWFMAGTVGREFVMPAKNKTETETSFEWQYERARANQKPVWA